MKLKLIILLCLAGLNIEAAAARSEFSVGQACYNNGEFKQAVLHFQQELRYHPRHAESYFWMGMSYQSLADIAFPFAGKDRSNARASLITAVELAPDEPDYRRALFNFLIDNAGTSRATLQQATEILRTVPPNGLDYASMRKQLERRSSKYASQEARGH
jgi:tetratricopeptide (TPR) repeat protein